MEDIWALPFLASPKTFLVTGSSGLVGIPLCSALKTRGHRVIRLVRDPKETGPDAFLWNPENDTFDTEKLPLIDAIVHLAGENVASSRWTEEKKRKIFESRRKGTSLIANAAVKLKPKVFICASAIGWYGSRGDEVLTEASPRGEGFFPEIAKIWEDSCEPARKAGIRVVNLRIGVVLSKRGGALKKMLLPFMLGIGGMLADGKHYMSWISIQDMVRAICFAAGNEKLRGPVNCVSPTPVTNREFTKTFGRVIHRPTIFPIPAFVLRLVFGEVADAALLSSMRVVPTALLSEKFPFLHTNLEDGLYAALEKEKKI